VKTTSANIFFAVENLGGTKVQPSDCTQTGSSWPISCASTIVAAVISAAVATLPSIAMSVASSAGAFELLTRLDTGQRCRRSSAAGFIKAAASGALLPRTARPQEPSQSAFARPTSYNDCYAVDIGREADIKTDHRNDVRNPSATSAVTACGTAVYIVLFST